MNSSEPSASTKNVLLRGIPASSGRAEGRVRIIKSAADSGKMEEGCVLVAPYTNPQFMTAILMARAIVTETGGVLSHAAIVSRELGIPCIVGAEGATSKLTADLEVIVDGDHGTVLRSSN